MPNELERAFDAHEQALAKARERNTDPLAMVQVAQAREAQEVQAAMVIAKKFPRDIVRSESRILEACRRTRLAEAAMYQYPRGGTRIEGASIRLAEVMAQCWGNIDFGVKEIEQRDGESTVLAYARDLETNTRQAKTFTVKHERTKNQGYGDNRTKVTTRLTDPRDIYEMVANLGARRLRACILGIIPGDIQDAAIDECRKTLTGASEEPLIDRIKKMALAFGENFGVSQEMIEARLGHKIAATDVQELIRLRTIYSSLQDGMSKRDDWFDVAPEDEVGNVDNLGAGTNKATKKRRKRRTKKEMQDAKEAESPAKEANIADSQDEDKGVPVEEGKEEAQQGAGQPKDALLAEKGNANVLGLGEGGLADICGTAAQRLSECEMGGYAALPANLVKLAAWASLGQVSEAEIRNPTEGQVKYVKDLITHLDPQSVAEAFEA